MSTRVDDLSWNPGWAWWCMLVPVMAAAVIGNWAIAAVLLVALLVNVARPFDFLAAFLMVTAGGAFVYYEGGRLTLELGLLTIGILWMLLCYLMSCRDRAFALSWSRLTVPLLAYLALSFANLGRGILSGYPPKHMGLELMGVLALGSAFLVANDLKPRRDFIVILVALVLTAYGSAAMGYHVFAVLHRRTAGVFFHPVPGIVALLLLNLALRSKTFVTALGWIALSLPLFLHQFLSFRRGLWLGCIAGFLVTIALFAGFGKGSGPRWRRVGLLGLTLIGAGLAGAFIMAVLYGQMDILEQAGGRLASIGDTDESYATAANFARLTEYATVIKHIASSPLIGHGLGYTFLVTTYLTGKTAPQWWVHQNFLFVSLKQGLLGLGVFVWMLWTGFMLGARETRRRSDSWESTWLATTAAGTAFLAVFSLSDFPLTQVNATFLLALLWGGTMAMTREGIIRFRWSTPSSETTGLRRGHRLTALPPPRGQEP